MLFDSHNQYAHSDTFTFPENDETLILNLITPTLHSIFGILRLNHHLLTKYLVFAIMPRFGMTFSILQVGNLN
jgi:hypothetical protein